MKPRSAAAAAAVVALGLCAGLGLALSRRGILVASLAADGAACLSTTAGPVLGGADVVAYFSLDAGSAATAGSAALNATYGGYSFYFSTAANRALFDADPTAYAPQFGGFCAWGIAEESVWTKATLGPDADADVWQILDGKLYVFMFDKPESKFLGATTDDDLDASGDTAAYVAAGAARWDGWFGDAVAFNTGCFWYDASSDTAEKAANRGGSMR